MGIIDVIIIEDDFRIANIHEEVIEQIDHVNVVEKFLTAEEALSYLKSTERLPRIILLDIYIPDVSKLELLEQLRRDYPYLAIIVASAANDIETIQRAKLLGVFDYLIKPIDQDRMQQAFKNYIEVMTYDEESLNQQHVDRFFKFSHQLTMRKGELQDDSMLPKGIDHLTLNKIKNFLLNYSDVEITAQSLGKEMGISRSTARRYLEYLNKLRIVSANLHYGQVGRPQRIYKIHEQYEQN